jgi:hypothetical protein
MTVKFFRFGRGRLAEDPTFQFSRPQRLKLARLLATLVLLLGVCAAGQSQTAIVPDPQPSSEASVDPIPDAPQPQAPAQPAAPAQPRDKDAVTLANTPMQILKEQAAIWSSPVRVREYNFPVLVPLVLASTLTMTVDHQIMSSSKLQNASLNSDANTASEGLLGGFVIAPVAIYGIGYLHHDEHATETGILAGQAMVDSLVVDEVLKAVTMRERPTLDGAKGKFFQTSVGLNSSFPSTHSIIAWSSATVIASEYRGPLTQITAYGLATGVSLTRVLARQHFPSDVLVGSAVGWLVGRYVVHRHRKDE